MYFVTNLEIMELKLTKPLAFFDLETTGINIVQDRIVEISIVKVMPDGSETVITQRINPLIPIPEDASKIHGITDEDVKDKPTFKDVAGDIATFLTDCDLAGYNLIKFDVPLLLEEFFRADIDFGLKNRRVVDVQNIFHKMEQRTLVAAYKYYCNKELTDAHSAEADTKATYEVLKAQLDKYAGVEYKDKEGLVSTPVVNNIDALSEFSYFTKNADMVGQIIFDDNGDEVFNFGKYKGKKVEDIFKKEPQYYDWMMKSDFPSYTKKVITGIKLRGFNLGK